MAEESGMSPSDVMAMMNNGGGMNGMWNNPFMYLIWLAIFGNGGFGGFGNNSATQNAVTRAELADGLNNQTVLNDLRSIESGTNSGINSLGDIVQNSAANAAQQRCNGFNTLNTSMLGGFNNVNTNMMGGFNNVGTSILQNGNSIVNAINQVASAQQIANCNLSHAIQDNKYEMAQNTCAITNAVHQEGEKTRGLLVDQQIQNLRDSKEEVERDLQSAQMTLANANQTQNILNSLGRYVSYSGCGTNCGCSNSSF